MLQPRPSADWAALTGELIWPRRGSVALSVEQRDGGGGGGERNGRIVGGSNTGGIEGWRNWLEMKRGHRSTHSNTCEAGVSRSGKCSPCNNPLCGLASSVSPGSFSP